MRVLATCAFSFAAAILAAVLLPGSGWALWAAVGAGACLAAAIVFRRKLPHSKRLLLILGAVTAGLLYFSAYEALAVDPVRGQCGDTHAFTGVVADYAVEREQGAAVTVWLHPFAKATLYGDETLLALEPGQRLSGAARWQDALRIREDDVTTFAARGVFVHLYQSGELTVEPELAGSVWFAPQRLARAVKERIGVLWSDPATAGFVLAELTGDRSGISEEDATVIAETGLSHLFAVSGLHCAFLVSLLGMLLSKKHYGLYFTVCIGVLLLYMLMVGMTPSVVRACIMQFFLLAAPLFRRSCDSLTSLAAALLVILLHNPYAIGGVSLQLSFAATLGLLLFSGRIYEACMKLYRGENRRIRRVLGFLAANLAASLSALVFTVPLTAYYFNILSLVAPLSSVLALPAAGWNFAAGMITVLLSFVWLSAGQLAGWVCRALVHYVLWVAEGLTRLPGHAVYFSNHYLRYWLGYVYLMLGGCRLLKSRRRAWIAAGVLSVLSLLLVVKLNAVPIRGGELSVLAVDVGQGECVILCSGRDAVVVDCGSSNGYISAGDRAADQLESIGFHRLEALVLTHYHADHTNGVAELMTRVPVAELYLPDIEDEYGVRDRLAALAEKHGTRVHYVVESAEYVAVGEALMTVYPPVGAGDMNEQGLTALCTAGDFDVLITGDMAGSTERELIARYTLPDVEVLVVSHHGSKYSSAAEFLAAVRPELAIICVGDNSYGHPTEEAMRRLIAAGAEIYRTDLQGNILVTAGGDE